MEIQSNCKMRTLQLNVLKCNEDDNENVFHSDIRENETTIFFELQKAISFHIFEVTKYYRL